MKIYVGYDKRGKILALAIPSDDAKDGEMGLDPEPGQYASEFEVDQGHHAQHHELLTDLFRNYRVEQSVTGAKGSSTPARLVKSGKPVPRTATKPQPKTRRTLRPKP
jgi:hypothetical protein